MKPTHRHRFNSFGRREEDAQADGLPRVTQMASETEEVMWLRDFLPDLIPNTRIMTYSYESDWRRADVKTSLRKGGEQLLNVLLQNRSSEKVGRIVPDIHHSFLLRVSIGGSTTASVYWTQPRRSDH